MMLDTGFISKQPYAAPSYEKMQEMGALTPGFTPLLYQQCTEELTTKRGIQVSDILYESDGLKVTGVEVLPKLQPGEKVPLVIYNRGGSGNFGMLNPHQILAMMVPFAQQMRAGVLASNYRGNGGSEGQEEWGGAEVNDVLRLIDIGKHQPWWDGKNIFMIGWSRGCMMNYLALKKGAQVNALVSGAGVSDLFASSALRPDMESVYQQFIPGFVQQREQLFAERSAIRWPEKISAPLLLLHGDADERVNVEESRRLNAALQAIEKPVKYVEFIGGNHGLSHQHAEVIQESVAWFEAHLAKEQGMGK